MTKVDLITGFLGAGKTTFILRYAKWLAKQGVTLAVIENEFGAAGCDGAILKDVGLDVSELSGGCICCSLKVDFAFALEALSGKVERVIVEPSGIFSPKDFFEVMGSPMLQGKCEIGCVAAVVDPFAAENISGTAAELFLAQVNSAGIVLMSMTGGMTQAQRDAAAAWITEERGRETVVKTAPWDTFSDLDFLEIQQSGAAHSARAETVIPHASLFHSAAIVPKRTFFPAEMEEKLRTILTEERFGTILRIKGAVPAAEGGSLWINCTPGQITVEPIRQGRHVLNVIGKGIVRAKIQDELMRGG